MDGESNKMARTRTKSERSRREQQHFEKGSLLRIVFMPCLSKVIKLIKRRRGFICAFALHGLSYNNYRTNYRLIK